MRVQRLPHSGQRGLEITALGLDARAQHQGIAPMGFEFQGALHGVLGQIRIPGQRRQLAEAELRIRLALVLGHQTLHHLERRRLVRLATEQQGDLHIQLIGLALGGLVNQVIELRDGIVDAPVAYIQHGQRLARFQTVGLQAQPTLRGQLRTAVIMREQRDLHGALRDTRIRGQLRGLQVALHRHLNIAALAGQFTEQHIVHLRRIGIGCFIGLDLHRHLLVLDRTMQSCATRQKRHTQEQHRAAPPFEVQGSVRHLSNAPLPPLNEPQLYLISAYYFSVAAHPAVCLLVFPGRIPQNFPFIIAWLT